jgi:hypothetical protein
MNVRRYITVNLNCFSIIMTTSVLAILQGRKKRETMGR